jgi:replication factor C small subunit
VVGQDTIISRLSAFIHGPLPHLLFVGPAGTGKTTAALCIARELYGDAYLENMLELNASDERGIDTIRHKVKNFARTKPITKQFKIIYLDECDALTSDAQQALRRTMEQYSETSRFILAANYSSKLIDPIQSRCAIFRFKRLSEDAIITYLKKIAKSEHLDLDKSGCLTIASLSQGDMRKAINLLQACSTFKHITSTKVYEVSGHIEPKDIHNMLTSAMSGKFTMALNHLNKILDENVLSGLDMVKAMHQEIFNLDIPDTTKIKLISNLGDCEFRLTQGADTFVQLSAFLAKISVK